MSKLKLVVSLAVMAASFVLPQSGAHASCGEAPSIEPMSFSQAKIIDPVRAGGEPSILSMRNGTLIYSTHAGTTHLLKSNLPDPNFVTPYTGSDYVWRSADNGASWQYIGFDGTGLGPHAGPGFSDPTLAEDTKGNVYVAGIDLANVYTAKSGDSGKTWAGNPVSALFTDREWLAADEENVLYMLATDWPGRVVLKSKDGGNTWNHFAGTPVHGVSSPITIDQNTGALYFPDDGGDLAHISVWPNIRNDSNYSYDRYVFYGLRHWFGFLNPSAVDDASHPYVVGNDDRNVYISYPDPDPDALAWKTDIVYTAPEDHLVLWPWISAGADGRVAVSWLEDDTLAAVPPPSSTALPLGAGGVSGAFRVMSAASVTAYGWTDECGDAQPSAWTTSLVTPDPIHVGTVCSNGTACNSDPGASGDRRLGDYFTTSIGTDGLLNIAFGDTQFQPSGAISHPAFTRQILGVKFR